MLRLAGVMLIAGLVMLLAGETWAATDDLEVHSAGNQSISYVIHTMLEDDSNQVATASLSYGCLGAYQGCIIGSIIGSNGFRRNSTLLIVGGSVVGATIGGYSGSRVDDATVKGFVIGGAIVATCSLLYYMLAGV